MRLLVTGGCGFIGSNFIRSLNSLNIEVLNIDFMGHGSLDIPKVQNDLNLEIQNVKVDLYNSRKVREAFFAFNPTHVINFAAESHVDRSIESPEPFINSNIIGTFNLLECARHAKSGFERFLHVSTDEVYGDLLDDDPGFTETTPYSPSSPYSASKAASDHLVSAWSRTFSLPTIITNCSNNYGPFQSEEKFIPKIISNIIKKKDIPVYGEGNNIRDWLYVEDHIDALKLLLFADNCKFKKYNIGGECELKNIDVVNSIIESLSHLGYDEKSLRSQIKHIKDRLGHDYRYAINCDRIKNEFNWKPKNSFEEGIGKTINYYLNESIL